MTHEFTESYDVIVIGAGHAGVEASLVLVVWVVKLYWQQSTLICWLLCRVILLLEDLPKG